MTMEYSSLVETSISLLIRLREYSRKACEKNVRAREGKELL